MTGKENVLVNHQCQAADLLMQHFLQKGLFQGKCSCSCNNGLTEAIFKHINENQADIVAEPVGSCTDLSATIIQPLKHYFGDKQYCT